MIIKGTYAENNEDVIIASVLAGAKVAYTPYFVDVGANDGFSCSNSWLFGLQGWPLLLVEPIPAMAGHCRTNHAGNGRVIVEEKAISPKAGTVSFFVTDDPDRDLLQMGSSLAVETVPFSLPSVAISVESVPLIDLLRKHDVPKDYAVLSVDAEGHDLAVLETAGFEEWRPALVCVELGEYYKSSIDSFLTARGYHLAISTTSNGMYLRDELDATSWTRGLFGRISGSRAKA